jgi:hypothetical protein
MKANPLLIFILLFFAHVSFQSPDIKLHVYINNNGIEVTEGLYINCLTIKQLNVTMPITDQMKDYDAFKLELHRFGSDIDIVAASKTFVPANKEFQRKYDSKKFVTLKMLAEESDFGGSDLEPNTIIFPAGSTINTVFCKSHDLKHCNFYLIVRGYKKTGEKNQFSEDVFDNGVDLSERSVVFKSWEDRTKK